LATVIVVLLIKVVGAGAETAFVPVEASLLKISTKQCVICHRDVSSMVEVDMRQGPECAGCHIDRDQAPVRIALTGQQGKGVSGKTTEMVKIPAGSFTIGYDHRHPDEKPSHTMSLPTFFIDLYEVTNGQYKEFVDTTHRTPPENWTEGIYPQGKKNHPVVFVTWYDAHDYCAWAGKRLPTEEEWEKAARGTDGRLYPWGNDFDPKKANTPQSHSTGTMPVGSFPQGRSPYGLYDMGGNAWEWTESWAKAYPGSPIPNGHYFTGEYKVLKGGSWVDCSFYRCGISSLTFNRGYFKPQTENQGFGFRCAKDEKK
jgi:formylglycine-generating enzyme required for sulfatase activity